MAPAALTIEISPHGDDLDVMLAGEIDASSCNTLRTCLADIPPGCRQVTLDLAAVTFMDSTGVAEIIRTAQHLEPEGRVVRVRNPHPHVQRLLELTGLTDLLSE
jgi:anti-sigma B factor antagonist